MREVLNPQGREVVRKIIRFFVVCHKLESPSYPKEFPAIHHSHILDWILLVSCFHMKMMGQE